MLLAGVNDCVHIQRSLVHKLVENRIRPYYLYQCDLVEGSGHFRTPVGKGLEIIEGLRGHTSGYAVPTYVVDAPGGGGKIPVMPNYLISYSDHKVVLRNYEGYITTYEEPDRLPGARPLRLLLLPSERPEPGQGGVHGLLQGDAMWIEPAGFAQIHVARQRGAAPAPVAGEVGALRRRCDRGQAGRPLPVLGAGDSGDGAERLTRPPALPVRTAPARSRGLARASPRHPRTGSFSTSGGLPAAAAWADPAMAARRARPRPRPLMTRPSGARHMRPPSTPPPTDIG